jgi:hypothetical protein
MATSSALTDFVSEPLMVGGTAVGTAPDPDFINQLDPSEASSHSAGGNGNPVPPPIKVDENKMLDQFYLIRGDVVPLVSSLDVLRHSLQLDADVYRYGSNGRITEKPVLANRHRFITNDSFKSAEEIDTYLRFWGRIPDFLEIRKTETKGYGVYSKVDIQPLTFLGLYQGIQRPVDKKIVDSAYNFIALDFDQKPCAMIDSENITFSNWTRFINDGNTLNIEFCVYNMQIYVFSSKDIKAGDELLGPYGEAYWKGVEQKGVKKFD